jgi:acyl carrier protein
MSSEQASAEGIEQAVREQIASRLKSRYGQHPALMDAQTLQALGIDSLDLHELADSLETALGVNPFEQAMSVNDVRTVGDLCRAYCAAAGVQGQPATEDAALLASRRRAETRRGEARRRRQHS